MWCTTCLTGTLTCVQSCTIHCSPINWMKCIDAIQQDFWPAHEYLWLSYSQRNETEHDHVSFPLQSPGPSRDPFQAVYQLPRNCHHCERQVHWPTAPYDRHQPTDSMWPIPTWPWGFVRIFLHRDLYVATQHLPTRRNFLFLNSLKGIRRSLAEISQYFHFNNSNHLKTWLSTSFGQW